MHAETELTFVAAWPHIAKPCAPVFKKKKNKNSKEKTKGMVHVTAAVFVDAIVPSCALQKSTPKLKKCRILIACHVTVLLCLSAVTLCMTDFDGFSLTACLQCAIYAYHTSAYPAPNCTLDLARKTFSLNTNQSRVYASFLFASCFMLKANLCFCVESTP